VAARALADFIIEAQPHTISGPPAHCTPSDRRLCLRPPRSRACRIDRATLGWGANALGRLATTVAAAPRFARESGAII